MSGARVSINPVARLTTHLTTASEIASRLAAQEEKPGRIVGLTFDDGLSEHAETVLPILRQRGVRATFSVLTGRIGRYRGEGRGPGRHPSPGEVDSPASAGMEIGSHGRSHVALSRLDPAGLREEIAGSRDDRARLPGPPPLSFSYPHGTRESCGDRAVEEVRAAGYAHAVCTTLRTDRPGSSPYELPRLPACDTDDPDPTPARARGACDRAGRPQGLWLRAFPHHASRREPR